MKIGISSYSFEKYRKETGADLFEVCRLAREIGFDAIEFIDLGTPDPIATAKALRAYCAEIGLTIASHTIGADLVNGDEEEILARIIPHSSGGVISTAVCEALASESGARRTSMNAANKNAEEIIGDLTLKYNRARQAMITQEITEIVSGADAL